MQKMMKQVGKRQHFSQEVKKQHLNQYLQAEILKWTQLKIKVISM